MKTRHRARELVLQTLYAMDFNNELSVDKIPDTFAGINETENAELEEEVKVFASLMLRGTLEELDHIDALISEFSINRPIEKIDIVDRNILRLSVYSFLKTDIHPHIIIDEAVKLSQEFSTDVTYKFINGILDAMQKKLSDAKENK
ncbi:MAG: transcription antitermination factor NusB [Spirochaetia bacterium]|nr:transcription antitermination factor NusB [Spirochaetia bacterium]